MKVLIIEDEPRAAMRLQKMILQMEPDFEIAEWLESVKDSVQYLCTHEHPELIFADIHLSDALSFEIFKQVNISAPVIFTTAYDAYAIEAFKSNGIDYLLKPVSQEDLRTAIDKYQQLTGKFAQDAIEKLSRQIATSDSSVDYKRRFIVKVGNHLKSFSEEEIALFYSKDKSNYLHTMNGRSYPIEQSMDLIEEQLDPVKFHRINRGCIVGMDAWTDILSYSNSRLRLQIKGLEEELIIVARERTKAFKSWIGG
jgi:DNA-binding LytR/AlgR family response regulator